MPVESDIFDVCSREIEMLCWRCFSCHDFNEISKLRLRHSICARFLCMIRMMPGGWTHASPSTWMGTPSSPKIVIWMLWHWAMRWCCKFIKRDAAIWTLSKWNAFHNKNEHDSWMNIITCQIQRPPLEFGHQTTEPKSNHLPSFHPRNWCHP